MGGWIMHFRPTAMDAIRLVAAVGLDFIGNLARLQ